MLATQNPVEQEGTYPLPEAQLDRFMFLIELDYPSEAEEIQIARTTTGDALPQLDHLLHADEVIAHQSLVRRVPVPDHIYTYAARLVRKTRPHGGDGARLAQAAGRLGRRSARGAVPDPRRQGPRGACWAATWSGWKTCRKSPRRCLTHRIITTFAAQAEGIDAKDIVRRLVEETGTDE